MKKISNPSAGTTIVSTVKPHEGGTGQITAPLAVNAIQVLKNDQINAAGGVAGSDTFGRLKSSQVPFENLSAVSLQGPTVVMKGVESSYVIRNFDTFTDYVVQAVKGTVNIVNDIVTYVAPLETGSAGFTLNGRDFVVTVKDYASVTPSITSPVAAASLVATAYTFTSSVFSVPDGQSAHASSDWQIATDAQFNNITFSSNNDTVNKLSWTVNQLVDATAYFVRVRHKGDTGTYSDWSSTVNFTVAIPVPVQPTITSHGNNSNVYATSTTFVTSAYSIAGSVSNHVSSDWQLSTASDFSSLFASLTDDATNLTSWTVPGLIYGSSYYLRMRHKAANGKTSLWSATVRINAVDAFVFNPVISVNTFNYNMRSAAIAAGWNQTKPLRMNVTVNSGAYIGSTSTGAYAFDTGASFPAGTVLSLVNNGGILGAGGAGGAGSPVGGNGNPGSAGGPALVANSSISISNNGTIGGGGGGGGSGGAGGQGGASNMVSGGAGGGQGLNGGGGGSPSVIGSDENGALYGYAGNGGNQNSPGSAGSPMVGSMSSGGTSGSGGSLGAAGGSGGAANGTAGYQGIGASGGSGGAAIVGNSNITWSTTGNRLGSIS